MLDKGPRALKCFNLELVTAVAALIQNLFEQRSLRVPQNAAESNLGHEIGS
jgi:hypothetical protein